MGRNTSNLAVMDCVFAAWAFTGTLGNSSNTLSTSSNPILNLSFPFISLSTSLFSNTEAFYIPSILYIL